MVPIAAHESGVALRDPLPLGPTRTDLTVIEVYSENVQDGRRILISWPPEHYLIADNTRYVWAIDIDPESWLDWDIKNVGPGAFGLDAWPKDEPTPRADAFESIDLESYWFRNSYLYAVDGKYNRETGGVDLSID